MIRRRVLAVLGAALVFTGAAGFAAAGDPAIVGTWKTEPDRKDLVSHIRVAPCGDVLCGTVAKIYDEAGNSVTTPNLGKRIIWDLEPKGSDGSYKGKIFLPLVNITGNVTLTPKGNRLRVKACKGPMCRSQSWPRVN